MDEQTRKAILSHYQKGQGSIQDVARIYNVPVDEVLRIIGAPELASVSISGDLIDRSEAGPGVEMNYGKEVSVPFTVN